MLITFLILNLCAQKAIAENITQSRLLFEKAETLAWYPSSTRYQELYNQLHFYPLQPYLDRAALIHGMSLNKVNDINNFLLEYQGTPLDYPLRKKWLDYLAKKKKKALFIHYFTQAHSAELTCINFQYKLDLGYPAKDVLPKVTDLWLTGKSQPKQCDRLFKTWQKAGYLTKDIVWQRIALAADGGDHKLLPYLTRLLPKSERYAAKLWHSVRRAPAKIESLSKFKNNTAKEAEILTYGLSRFIWKKPDRALSVFSKVKKTHPFTQEQLNHITVKFALALASKKHDSAQYWLHQVEADNFTDLVVQWRIAAVLRHGKWPKIKQELLSLPLERQTTNQWQYWYGRSLLETNEVELGEALLNRLAQKRHYYGFLAASYMKKSIKLQNQPLEITDEEKANLLNHNAAKRAFEFFKLGRYRDARREWNYLVSHITDRDKLVAAKIANEQGWYDRAIFTLASVGYLNDVNLRFPRAFDNEITQHARARDIDPAWAFAIARRESSFMTDADSSVGAKGLMQMMPRTAKRMARKKVSTKYLFNADNNIKLGTKYLKLLLDKHKGNQVLATAAYNAGPYRVKTWLKDADTLPVDIWIETIPYKETREYVKSVMAYQQIYLEQSGTNVTLFDDLLAMQIPDK